MLKNWKALLGIAAPGEKTCFCGGKLPTLERCIFNFKSGSEASYLLGQCSRCRTVFWEKAP